MFEELTCTGIFIIIPLIFVIGLVILSNSSRYKQDTLKVFEDIAVEFGLRVEQLKADQGRGLQRLLTPKENPRLTGKIRGHTVDVQIITERSGDSRQLYTDVKVGFSGRSVKKIDVQPKNILHKLIEAMGSRGVGSKISMTSGWR